MRTLLISLMVLGLVGGMAGGGLFAHFTDTEQSANNTFQAGYIDLTVDGLDYVATENLALKPCQWMTWDKHVLRNAGTLDGHVSMQLICTAWSGGDNAEPELALQSPNICDLQNYLEIIVVYSTADDLIPIVQGCANVDAAVAALTDHGYGPNLLYGGLLSRFDGASKNLGDLLAGGQHNFQVLVHLQQPADANKLMGDYVKVDKIFHLDQFTCGEQPGGGKGQILPTGTVQLRLDYPGTNSYWTATLSGVGSGYAVHNGVYKCWCIDDLHLIYSGQTWNVKLVSSLNPAVYNHVTIQYGYNPPDPNAFNYVNYLINHYTAGGGESSLQHAIWHFIDNTSYAWLVANDPVAKNMVDMALLNGGSYVPDGTPGNNMALVVAYLPSGFQIVGLEVDP